WHAHRQDHAPSRLRCSRGLQPRRPDHPDLLRRWHRAFLERPAGAPGRRSATDRLVGPGADRPGTRREQPGPHARHPDVARASPAPGGAGQAGGWHALTLRRAGIGLARYAEGPEQIDSGKPLGPVLDHRAENLAFFRSDGETVLTVSQQMTIRHWKVP